MDHSVVIGNHQLDENRLKELRDAFDLFDKDGDGRITAIELLTVMRSLRLEPTEEDVRRMITQADIDGNGSVEFNEFILLMTLVKDRNDSDDAKKRRREAEVLQAFRVFDIDGDGLIDAQEIKVTMTNLGEILTDNDVREMIRAADRNNDGKIDFQEFVGMIAANR